MRRRIRRNWSMIYMLTLTVVWVVSASIYGQQVGIIAASFPKAAQYVWYVGLGLGAVIALIGSLWASVTGMMIERAALFIVAGLCLAFGTAFLAVAARGNVSIINAIYAGPLVFLFGAVCAARVHQIAQGLREYRDELHRLGDTLTSIHRVPPEVT